MGERRGACRHRGPAKGLTTSGRCQARQPLNSTSDTSSSFIVRPWRNAGGRAVGRLNNVPSNLTKSTGKFVPAHLRKFRRPAHRVLERVRPAGEPVWRVSKGNVSFAACSQPTSAGIRRLRKTRTSSRREPPGRAIPTSISGNGATVVSQLTQGCAGGPQRTSPAGRQREGS